MKLKILTALMIMNIYASPLGHIQQEDLMIHKRHDPQDSTVTSGPIPPGSAVTDTSIIENAPLPPDATVNDTTTVDHDDGDQHDVALAIGPPPPPNYFGPAAPSKYGVPWQALVGLNPHLNPYYVPAGAVVIVPPGSAWTARYGETILSVAQHFVKCYYGPKATLDPYLLGKMNGVYSITAPLHPGFRVRLPPDAGYLAFAPTTFQFISRYLVYSWMPSSWLRSW